MFWTGGSLAGLSMCCTSPSVVVTPVDDRGRGGDEVEVVLALQPLLDDLHVQQAEEAAAEAEAERLRGLRLEGEGGVVEPQLLQRVAQVLVVGGVDRVDAGEDHRLDFLEAGERRVGRRRGVGDGVADLGVGDVLDVGDEKPDLARHQLLHRRAPWGRDRRAPAPRTRGWFDQSRIFCLVRSVPSSTRTSMTTPR